MRLLIVSILLFSVFVSKAQLTVDNNAPNNSPQYLVENVLLGNGVTASNITFSGDPLQIGYFDGSASNIGLGSGIVMSTGDIADLEPGGFGSFFTGNVGEPDLLSVAASVPNLVNPLVPEDVFFTVSSINDVAVLEFDFVPSSDSLEFRFVFGSAEYPSFGSGGYIYNDYNDAFGFFISGPGLNGPYQNNAINVATVPNSNPELPISISTIHPGTPSDPFSPIQPFNDQYYIDNSNQTSVATLNGFTTVLTARAVVTPCETYHIKLTIGDGSDSSLDSGVFLEANSFSSGEFTVTPQADFSSISGDTVLFEGCGDATLTFGRTGEIDNPYTLHFNLLGDAVNGVDYPTVADSIVFAAGSNQEQLTLYAITDGINEGIESVYIEIPEIQTCGLTVSNGVTIYISDPLPVDVVAEDDTLDCFSATAQATAQASGGISPYTYSWSNGSSNQTQNVTPNADTYYLVTVTDVCGQVSAIDTSFISVDLEPLVVGTSDYNVQCPWDTLLITPEINLGFPPYEVIWESGTNALYDTISVGQTTVYNCTVTDYCKKDSIATQVTVHIPIYPPIQILLNQDTMSIGCPGETIAANPEFIGGSPPYVSTWDNWASINLDSLVASPKVTTEYIIQATDYCNTDTVQKSFVVQVPDYSNFRIEAEIDSFICPGESALMYVHAEGGAGGYKYEWSDFLGSDTILTVSPNKTKTYSVEVTDACGEVTEQSVTVTIQVPKAGFEVDYLSHQNGIIFENTSSKDVVVSSWDFGDGSSLTTNLDSIVHAYEIIGTYIVGLEVKNKYGCQDKISMQITPPTFVYLPSAFSPNNDGFNEEFYPRGQNVKSFEMVIYNRWGQVVFSTDDFKDSWDGKMQGGSKVVEPGVYIYKYSATSYDGESTVKGAVGTVTVIK